MTLTPARPPSELRPAGALPRGTVPARRSRRRRVAWAPYLLLTPAGAVLGLLLLWPLVRIAVMSLQEIGLRQLRGAPTQWVGLDNYREILADPFFWRVLANTVGFAVVTVTLTLVAGTLVGLLLNRLGRRMAAFVASGVMLAWAVPSITASIVFRWLFNDTYGIVNWTLDRLPDPLAQLLFGRAEFAGFSWFNSTSTTFAVLVTVVVWQSFPFVAVTVLAGCKTVPTELYEAARIDGASGWRTFWSITFPILRPVFAVLVILSTIWDFKVFTQLYVIAGLAHRDAYMLSLYAYAEAFASPPRFGTGSALAVVLVLILLTVTVGYVRLTLRQEQL